MQVLSVNGIRLHHAISGPDGGAPVVLAHSLGTDFRIWRDVVVRLAGDFPIITYDKRGHGLSEETPGPYSIEQLADDAAGLIEALGLRDVVFVGHGHFSRAVITRWIEQPVYEGIRFAMPAVSIAVCGFEHGVRQLSALGLTGHPDPAVST